MRSVEERMWSSEVSSISLQPLLAFLSLACNFMPREVKDEMRADKWIIVTEDFGL